MSTNNCVVPGDIIGDTAQYLAGDGTFTRGNSIHAGIAGFTHITDTPQGKKVISVGRVNQKPLVVPQQGNVVLGRVCLRNI